MRPIKWGYLWWKSQHFFSKEDKKTSLVLYDGGWLSSLQPSYYLKTLIPWVGLDLIPLSMGRVTLSSYCFSHQCFYLAWRRWRVQIYVIQKKYPTRAECSSSNSSCCYVLSSLVVFKPLQPWLSMNSVMLYSLFIYTATRKKIVLIFHPRVVGE